MEAILKFNLPDDQEDYDRMNKAGDMCALLWDLGNFLRGKVKYNDIKEGQTAYEAFEEVQDKLGELYEEHDINLDKIYR